MSRRNGPKHELKLNISPPRLTRRVESPSRAATVSPTTPSSCLSSDVDMADVIGYSSSPDSTSSPLSLVACSRCLMYVMLSEDDPKCPRCKSTVLLDFLRDTATTTNVETRKR